MSRAPSEPVPDAAPSGRAIHLPLALVGAGALAGLSWSAWALWRAPAPGHLTLLTALGLWVGWVFLERRSFPFLWRGHRYTMSLEEAAVALALIALPAGLVPMVGLAGTVAAQVISGRRGVKAFFNGANHAAVTCLVTLVHLQLLPWLDPLPASLVAVGIYTVLTTFLVGVVFARLERAPLWAVWRERMGRPTLLQAILAVSLATTVGALWSYHPATLLAAVPFLLTARGYLDHRVRSEHVLRVHGLLMRLQAELGRVRNADAAAEFVLQAGADLLPASRVTLILHGPTWETPRVWTRTFPRLPHAWTFLEAPLVGDDGRALGLLRLDVEESFVDDAPELGRAPVGLLAAEAARGFERLRRLEKLSTAV